LSASPGISAITALSSQNTLPAISDMCSPEIARM
jgi:hypothetical protein